MTKERHRQRSNVQVVLTMVREAPRDADAVGGMTEAAHVTVCESELRVNNPSAIASAEQIAGQIGRRFAGLLNSRTFVLPAQCCRNS